MPFGGLLTAGLIGAGGSIISGLFGASAATKAARAQVAEQEKALAFQQSVYADQKANQAPFVQAGQFSIGKIAEGLQNGTFGPGSIAAFKAPTLEEARATPGYAFTAEQGDLGIQRGSAAAGGAITGGTLKALDQFNTGLADATYNNVFARALAGYNTQLQSQAQSFGQLATTAGIGENAANNVNTNGTQASATIGNTLGNIGNDTAAGIVGSTNSIIGAVNGATSALTTPFYLNYLKSSQGGSNGSGSGPGINAAGQMIPATYNYGVE
jgi:hypothetical protein